VYKKILFKHKCTNDSVDFHIIENECNSAYGKEVLSSIHNYLKIE
jgi:hypothetical protein